jgi:hypothetical protein
MWTNPEVVYSLVHQHLNWYPLMELRDVFKLLYQGVLGSEHLVTLADDFKLALRAEFDTLTAISGGRLLEPVHPKRKLLRFNLRVYKSMQTDLDQLVPVFLETAKQTWGTQAELQVAWANFAGLCEQGRIKGFPLSSVNGFSAWLERQAYPPLHHSETYRWAYQPSYRLISAGLISSLELMGEVRI